MLRIGDRREFVLGLYQLPNRPDPWKEARQAGFGLVHAEGSRAELDTAAAHGLRAWVTIGSVNPRRRASDEARIRKIVGELKDHPALLFWETEDEPTYLYQKPGARVPVDHILAAHRFARALDPAHPFYLNHAPTNLVETLRQYNEASDIVATDIYPVMPRGLRQQYGLWPDGRHGDLPDDSVSQVGRYADKMRAVAGPSRAVFMVLQAFAWEMLRKPGDRHANMVLYPTREELRFMSWQAIAHGVNGLLFWGLKNTPPGAPLWEDLQAVGGELRALGDELAAPRRALELRLDYQDTGHSLDRGIEWIAKPSGKDVLLVAVNADRNPVEVTFTAARPPRGVTLLPESRPARVERGAWRATFPGFGVRLYKLRW